MGKYFRIKVGLSMAQVFCWLATVTALLILPSTIELPELSATIWLLMFLGWSLLISVPADIIAGKMLPERQGMYSMIFDGWWKKWLRAIIVQTVFFLLMGGWLLFMGSKFGRMGTIGGFSLMMLLTGGLQIWLARATVRWESFFDNHKGKLVVYLDNEDPAFTGGISGIPGMEIFVIPNSWRKEMDARMLGVIKGRRHGAIQTLGHAKGFLAAFLLNLLAFTAAILLIEDGTSTGLGLVQTVSLFGLFQVAGTALILTPLSRKAVWEVDRWVFYRGGDADSLRASFHKIAVNEELAEFGTLSSVLQPMPSPSSRSQHIASQQESRGAWNAARLSIFLSWAALNPLARSLPIMLGRPERWVFLPSD